MSVSIFSAPKPFSDPHITTIQRNAIQSWTSQGSQVEVMLIGDDPGIGEVAAQLGVTHLPVVDRNDYQTPLINSIFDQAQSYAHHSIMTYINADIILLDDFVSTVEQIDLQQSDYLIVGQRWDLDQKTDIEFAPSWEQAIRHRLELEGSLHPPAGSDYFVFPRGQFEDLPPFALGRAGWDNWMIFKGRSLRIPVIDASTAITVVHQTHDYGHLKGGAPHYQSKERYINVQLAGGSDTVFTIADATWRMNGQGLEKIPWPQGGFFRWVKSSLVARFAARKRLRFLRVLLHPLAIIRYRISSARRRDDQAEL